MITELATCRYGHGLTIERDPQAPAIVYYRCYCAECTEHELGDVLDACTHIGHGDTPGEALGAYRDECGPT